MEMENMNMGNDTIIKNIKEAVLGLDYGDVLIKVHNSRIVQIEVTQRRRFDDAHKIEGGAGI